MLCLQEFQILISMKLIKNAFLGLDDTFTVIISFELSESQDEKLLIFLR